MALRDQPYLPLYVQDFLTDEKLIECSAESTGVYIRIMCIMHKSEEYGKILLNQKYKQTPNQIKNFASKLSVSLPYQYQVIERSLMELLEAEVLHIDGNYLIQKRMVKDAAISVKRSISGKKGGNPKFAQGQICLTKSASKTKKFAYPKMQANAESEIENESDVDIENYSLEKGGKGEKTKNGKTGKSSQDFAGSETPNVENHCTEGEDTSCEVLDELSFENVWSMYGRKGNRKTSLRRWDGLPKKAKQLAARHIPRYVAATPEVQFRKNFETYINQEAWNDQIITRHGTNSNGCKASDGGLDAELAESIAAGIARAKANQAKRG